MHLCFKEDQNEQTDLYSTSCVKSCASLTYKRGHLSIDAAPTVAVYCGEPGQVNKQTN